MICSWSTGTLGADKNQTRVSADQQMLTKTTAPQLTALEMDQSRQEIDPTVIRTAR